MYCHSLAGCEGVPFAHRKNLNILRSYRETLTVKQLFGTTEVAGTSLQLINAN